MPLNFEASENGEYTISIKAENAEFDYLHLIDNLTGTDIDLLPLGKGGKEDFQPATYTFTAKRLTMPPVSASCFPSAGTLTATMERLLPSLAMEASSFRMPMPMPRCKSWIWQGISLLVRMLHATFPPMGWPQACTFCGSSKAMK